MVVSELVWQRCEREQQPCSDEAAESQVDIHAPARGVRGFGVSVAGDSCRSRVVVCDLRLSSSRLGFTSHAWVDTATTALTGTRTPMTEPGIGIPISTVKLHKPHFTPQLVQDLCEKTRGKFSVSQEEKVRQHACTFIEAVGAKIGL